jgi:hypothetical protein
MSRRQVQQIRNPNFEIGPTDSPPCGRVPSFETISNSQNSNVQNGVLVSSVSTVLDIREFVLRICFVLRASYFGFDVERPP